MVRELHEELGIKINIKNLKSLDIHNHSYNKKNYIMMNLFCLNKWSGKIRNRDTKKFIWINKTGPFPNKFLDGGLTEVFSSIMLLNFSKPFPLIRI